jgi:hypothetical protein
VAEKEKSNCQYKLKMKDIQGHQQRSSHPVYGIIVYGLGKFLRFKCSNYEIILAYK